MDVSHPLESYLIANVAIILASLVQTSTGMGFAMIAVPLLALISVDLVPGPVLFVNLFLSLMMLGDGRAFVVRKEIAILCPTIVIGAIIGAAILTMISKETIGILIAITILLAVAISAFAKAQPLMPKNLAIGGVAVGVMGASAGIPGAPLVILYQNEDLRKTRPTMALVFTFSYIVSLIALYFGGAFSLTLAVDGLLLLPGLLAGFFFGRWIRVYMSQKIGRILMLSIASGSSVILLIKTLAA